MSVIQQKNYFGYGLLLLTCFSPSDFNHGLKWEKIRLSLTFFRKTWTNNWPIMYASTCGLRLEVLKRAIKVEIYNFLA